MKRFLILSVLALAALGGGAGSARSAAKLFVLGGGQTIRTTTESTNELLDPIILKDRVSGWELGGGFRLFPQHPGDQDASRPPRWEMRFRYKREGGDLKGNSFQVTHTGQRNPYSYSVTETYRQTSWMLGGSFVSRPLVRLPRLGVFAGPVLQSVTLKANRSLTGTLPDPKYFPVTNGGSDRLDRRYGFLEAGIQWSPAPNWPGVEAYWIPARYELSAGRRAAPGDWAANFPTLKNAIGARLIYDF